MERFIMGNTVTGLTEEEKNSLAEQIEKHFEWCKCYPTCDRENTIKIVDTWFKAKSGLINLFMKHPNYNGNYAIEFDKPIQRNFDMTAFKEFLTMVRNWSKTFGLTEVKIGDYFYGELEDRVSKLRYEIETLESFTGYGEAITDLISKLQAERTAKKHLMENIDFDTYYVSGSSKAYLRSDWDKVDNFNAVIRSLSAYGKQFLDDETANFINGIFPNFKAKAGQKTSRVVNKLCSMLGLDKVTNEMLMEKGMGVDGIAPEKNVYNIKFAKFADACNPFNVTKHVFISIHPIDFLTMAWGTDWSSCHSTDKGNRHNWSDRSGASYGGMYSSGCVSYMLDSSSVVFYILGDNAIKEAEEMGEPTPRKEMRQMFHIGNEKFIQGRLYPFDQTDKDLHAEPEDYIQYRLIVQEVLAQIWDIPNLWTNKKGSTACLNETQSFGTHYQDYNRYDNVNISYIKGYGGTERIVIGHKPICPRCGQTHTENDNCFCYSCKDQREGMIYCAYHDEWEEAEEEDGAYVENYHDNGWVCNRALEDSGYFIYCDQCNEWRYDRYGDECIRSERDDRLFCCRECAESTGYYYNDFYDDWLHEDDTSYSEIDRETLPTFDIDEQDLCWAHYDDTDDVTIARQDSCVRVPSHGNEWYDEDMCVEANGEWYLDDDCEWSEIDREDLPIIDANLVNENDAEKEFCYAIYEPYQKITTIARTESCRWYNGEWYDSSLFVKIDGEFYLEKDTRVNDETGELEIVA